MNSQQQQQQGQAQQPPPPSSQGPPSQADSPFDLSSFIAFPTANSIGHLPAGNDDLYRSFAQGIKSTSNGPGGAGPSGSTGGMDGGYQAAGGYQQQGQGAGSSGRPQSSHTKAAGGNGGNGGQGNNAGGNGLSPYGLDPSAFHGEVKFQVSVGRNRISFHFAIVRPLD